MRAGRVGVGAAGPGVTAVDAVQAAVRDEQRGQAWGRGEVRDGEGRRERKHKKTSTPRPKKHENPGRVVKDQIGLVNEQQES